MSNPSHGVAIHLAQCRAAESKVKIQFLTTKPICFAIAIQDLGKRVGKFYQNFRVTFQPMFLCKNNLANFLNWILITFTIKNKLYCNNTIHAIKILSILSELSVEPIFINCLYRRYGKLWRFIGILNIKHNALFP